jgi:hypothetical protein
MALGRRVTLSLRFPFPLEALSKEQHVYYWQQQCIEEGSLDLAAIGPDYHRDAIKPRQRNGSIFRRDPK